MSKRYARFVRNPPESLKMAFHFWVECECYDENPFNESSPVKHLIFKPDVIAPYPLNHFLVSSFIGCEVEFTENTQRVYDDNHMAARKLINQFQSWKKKVIQSYPFSVKESTEEIDDHSFLKLFKSYNDAELQINSVYDLEVVKKHLPSL